MPKSKGTAHLLLSGMDKTFLHWKAEHPLLFITVLLIIGNLCGAQISFFQNINSIVVPLFLIGLSWIIYIMIRLHIKSTLLCGVTIYLIMLTWGLSIFLLSKQYDVFRIDYPETYIIRLRSWLIFKINQTIVHKEANAYAQAMLLGVKGEMDKNLLKAYANLGIIHIIAISGMHLEIIFGYLSQITKWLPRKRFFLRIELIFILTGIWTYTCMAFASPSVVRASLFFSLYLIGKFFNLHQYTLNSIAAGIFIVLLFDAHALSHIGLQLSYAAVIGIHLFHPLIQKMNAMDNSILKYLWSNLSITIAAGLTTTPILVYHFHQASTLVILSNFLMVPLSNILLSALILLILTPNYFSVAKWLGTIIERYILWINETVTHLYGQSKYQAPTFNVNMQGLIIYFGYLLLLYLWVYKKRPSYLFYMLALSSLLILIKLFSKG